MVRESNQYVYLIMIDASSFAEFEISEFEISRVDCICMPSTSLLVCVGAAVVRLFQGKPRLRSWGHITEVLLLGSLLGP